MSTSTPDGERVQQLVYDWLNRKYPEGRTWYAKSAASLALEIRMISAFDDIECNLANGGWAQFLWNCFDYWRPAIEGAKAGYLLIGAPEQSAGRWKPCARCASAMNVSVRLC